MKSKTVIKKKVAVKAYFTNNAEGLKVKSQIEAIAKRTGLSVSKVTGMALRFGLPAVDNALQPFRREDEKQRRA